MRLVVATPLYPPDIGGPATYARTLEIELPKRGIDVSLVKFSAVRRLPKVIRHVAYFWNVFRALRGADAILALDPVSVGFPAVLAAKLRRVPFIVKVVGDHAWEQGAQHSGLTMSLDEYLDIPTKNLPRRVRWHRYIQESVVHAAARVMVPSKYLSRVVLAWGADPRTVRVVYNTFDPPRHVATREEARKHYSAAGPVIISAGRLVPWKGFAELIELLPQVVAKFPHAELLIAGDGPEKGRLNDVIAKHGLASRVTLLGSLPREELLERITAAECFVLNTRYEGLSHQLLEVMAVGTPIVTTQTGGNPELVENKKDGRLIEPGNTTELTEAIMWVLRHESDSRKMAEHARTRLSEFTLERMISGTIDTLREVAPVSRGNKKI